MSTTQTEALKLALEALEDMHIVDFPLEDLCNWNKAITAIKEALRSSPNGEAQPAVALEQRSISEHLDPVAWQDTAKPTELVAAEDWDNIDPQWHWMYRPLYTTPPQRKPLTDEEIRKLWAQHAATQNGWPNDATPPMLDIGNGPRFQAHWHESEYQVFRAGFKAAHGIKGDA